MRNLFGQDIPATDPGTATDTPTARKKEAKQPDPNGLRKVGCNRTKGAYFARRVKSELNLEETLPWHFEHGAAYHCFFIRRRGLAHLPAGSRQAATGGILFNFHLVHGDNRR